MFSFLSRPKPALRPQPSLIQKALSFAFASAIIGLLAIHPVHAQTSGGYWSAEPCDANGQPLSYASTDNYGFYEMHGTEHWTIAQTYFPDSLFDDFSTNPYNVYGYLSAAYPLEYLLAPYTDYTIQYGGIGAGGPSGTPLGVTARNYSQYQWYYSLSPEEDDSANTLFNGSVTVDTIGQLVYYFKVQWQPYSSPTPTTPIPDHINLLLKTQVSAFAALDAFTDPIVEGMLKAKATATDQVNGAGFNETASASVSESSTAPIIVPPPGKGGIPAPAAPEVPLVIGHHLVRAAVDPNTGIAEVYLNGMTHWEATNTVPYGDPTTGQETNKGAEAYALSGVGGGVKIDNREVTLSSSIEDSYYKGVYDVPHGTDRYLHLRDLATGAIAVDSVVDWHSDYDYDAVTGVPVSISGFTKGWQINGLPITANVPNFQDPSYDWSISGIVRSKAWMELPLQSLSNPANFYLIEPDQDQFPLNCTVRVDVNDNNDGALAANNTYNITWHLPYEKTAFLGSVPKKVKLEKLYGPIGQGDTSDVQISAARDIKIDEGFELAGGIAAAVGQEEGAAVLEIIGKLAKLTDAKFHYGGENVQYGTQNGPAKWTATLNNPDWSANVDNPALLNFVDPRTGEYDGWVFFDLEIYEVKHYHHMTWAADKYNSHGYESSGHFLYSDPVDKIDEEPYYTQTLFPNPQ